MNIPKFEIAAGDKSSIPARQAEAVSAGFAALERANGFAALSGYGEDKVVLQGEEKTIEGIGIAKELLAEKKGEER